MRKRANEIPMKYGGTTIVAISLCISSRSLCYRRRMCLFYVSSSRLFARRTFKMRCALHTERVSCSDLMHSLLVAREHRLHD